MKIICTVTIYIHNFDDQLSSEVRVLVLHTGIRTTL